MKKQSLIFVLFFFMAFSYGQKRYSFDYIIEYGYRKTQEAIVEKKYILTNSTDDSYVIYATESTSGNGDLNVFFRDVKGVRSSFMLKKTDLIKAETITLDCNLVYDFDQVNESAKFIYEINKDTIIDKKEYKIHTMKSRNKRLSKRYDKGKAYYVVEKKIGIFICL